MGRCIIWGGISYAKLFLFLNCFLNKIVGMIDKYLHLRDLNQLI